MTEAGSACYVATFHWGQLELSATRERWGTKSNVPPCYPNQEAKKQLPIQREMEAASGGLSPLGIPVCLCAGQVCSHSQEKRPEADRRLTFTASESSLLPGGCAGCCAVGSRYTHIYRWEFILRSFSGQRALWSGIQAVGST